LLFPVYPDEQTIWWPVRPSSKGGLDRVMGLVAHPAYELSIFGKSLKLLERNQAR
jgi:hypothetical protein